MDSTQTDETHLPLILTKLKAPVDFGNLLSRPRLIEKLSKGIHHRVTLIRGSAGFGKTSLAMQWRDYLLEKGAKVAWLSLDSDDNNTERCISHIVTAISQVEPSIDINTIALSQNKSQQTITFIFTELINQLSITKQDIYIIIDDWHLINNGSLQKALGFLIEHAPANFHLIICTRNHPPLPLYTLRVKNQLFEIDMADLRFSETEINTFFRRSNNPELDKRLKFANEDVRSIWKKTEGWAASLQLILLLLRTSRTTDLHQLSVNLGENHSIGEYLTENVINNLPKDTLDFLLKTSILNRLNGELCDVITKSSNSQVVLESLYKQGLFTQPLDTELDWFQYHHLFALFLQKRLKRQYPEKLHLLHTAAAEWFIKQGQVNAAVRHLLAVEETEKAVSLVESKAMWMVEHSYMARLLSLVDKLPKQTIMLRYELQIAIAWAHCLTHHHQEAQETLDSLANLLTHSSHPNEKNLRIELDVLQACVNMYADRLSGIEDLLTPCLDNQKNSNPWVRVVAKNVLTYVYLNTYRFREVSTLQQRAERLHTKTRGPFSSVYGECFMGLAMLAQCNLSSAKYHFSQALERATQKGGEDSHMAYLAGTLLGHIYYERNQLDKAEHLLSRSRKLGAEGGVADFYIATYCIGSRLESLKGNFAEAYAILNEGLHVANKLQTPRLNYALKAEFIELYLSYGDVRTADGLMKEWDKKSFNPSVTPILSEQILAIKKRSEAHLLCKQDLCQQGIEELFPILETSIKNACLYNEVKERALLAGMLEHSGRKNEAEAMLLPALEVGFEQQMMRTFIDEGQEVMKVIKRISKANRQQNQGVKSLDYHRWLLLLLKSSDTFINERKRQNITLTHECQHNEKLDNPTNANIKYDSPHSIPMSDTSTQMCSTPKQSPDFSNVSNTLGTSSGMLSNITPESISLIEPLKDKEKQILRMLETGLTNKEIASNLNIGVNTVKWYLKSIYSKLGVSRRTQAVSEAKRLNLAIEE